jgi:hypothetical protein
VTVCALTFQKGNATKAAVANAAGKIDLTNLPVKLGLDF